MKRPIYIITLGFIIGIIGGLYLNIVPFVFLLFIPLLIIVKFLKIDNKNNLIRVLKVFIKNNILLIIVISAFISSVYINLYENKYEKVYKEFLEGEVISTVVSDKKEGEYKSSYKIKLETFNNQEYRRMYFLLRVPNNKNIDIKYGDKISFLRSI